MLNSSSLTPYTSTPFAGTASCNSNILCRRTQVKDNQPNDYNAKIDHHRESIFLEGKKNLNAYVCMSTCHHNNTSTIKIRTQTPPRSIIIKTHKKKNTYSQPQRHPYHTNSAERIRIVPQNLLRESYLKHVLIGRQVLGRFPKHIRLPLEQRHCDEGKNPELPPPSQPLFLSLHNARHKNLLSTPLPSTQIHSNKLPGPANSLCLHDPYEICIESFPANPRFNACVLN